MTPGCPAPGPPDAAGPDAGGEGARAEFLLRLAELTQPEYDEQVLREVCAGLAAALGMRRTSLYLGRGDELMPAVVAMASGPGDPIADAVLGEVGGPPALFAAAIARGRAVVAESGDSPLLAGWLAPRLSVESALAVPLVWGGEQLGVLMVDGDRPRPVTPIELRLFEATARQLAGLVGRERESEEADRRLATAAALRHVLEMGVRACSPIEAAEALAICAATALGVPVGSAYLVDPNGLISDIATVGADPEQNATIRKNLIGQPAAGSPVWRRVMQGIHEGPDLIADAQVGGAVRKGGVAESLGLRFLATIPLLSSDGPVGLILCGDRQPHYDWPEGTRELLRQLALEGTIVVDNARLRESERHRATHDALTGLVNRQAFTEHLDAAVRRARRDGTSLTVLLADLDRFKEVNDALGHTQGDALLVEVARRLRRSLRDADVVARLGGDEFTAMLSGTTLEGAQAAADRVVAALAEPVQLGHVAIGVDTSIGIARFPEHGEDVDALMQHADIAMYAAKADQVAHRVYDPTAGSHQPDRLALVADLRAAIAGDGLSLHYQPKIRLADGAVVGAEALVRWAHPRLGPLQPHHFVPLAEASGLIRPLTAWVARRALSQCARWHAAGVDLPVSVNVSAKDLADHQLGDDLVHWLADAGVPASLLTVELTESAVMADRDAGIRALSALRALGVRVSLDDFGTGYSSLGYLTTIPLDEMKIDRSFVVQGLGDERAVIVRTVIALGQELGLTVVAEGVESAEDCARLATYGCDQVQGFALCPPLPPDELERWLTERAGDARSVTQRAGEARSAASLPHHGPGE